MTITKSSGNVFTDLGMAEPEEALAKAQLAQQIAELIKTAGLTQAAAAKRLGLTQPKVSAILHGRLGGFSMEKLLHCLKRLGSDVSIVVKRPGRRSTDREGSLRVAFR